MAFDERMARVGDAVPQPDNVSSLTPRQLILFGNAGEAAFSGDLQDIGEAQHVPEVCVGPFRVRNWEQSARSLIRRPTA